MKAEGGCYCGGLRYQVDAEPMFKGQCHCRECQYISGGGPNYVMLLPETGFSYGQGTPKGFSRSDLEAPVTREFCADCGTHILTRSPAMAGVVIIKVGTLDDPAAFKGPKAAIYTAEKQGFHFIPDTLPSFEGFPPV